MATISFWARSTSSTANASTLVVGSQPATQISFTNDNPNVAGADTSGDLVLESTGGAIDPDTWVIINGVSYTFTYDLVGTFPVNDGKVPDALEGRQVAVIQTAVGNFFFVLDGSGTRTLMNQVGNGNLKLDATVPNPPPVHVCFCAGTGIATPRGPRPVESLRPGDMILTEDGRAVQVAWVGMSAYSAAQLAADPALRPVRIPAHAIRPGLPERDLDLSPQHRIVLEGAACELLFGLPRVFVAARHLLGTIAHVPEEVEDVRYLHVLLEDHEIILGNGLPSESFQPARRMIELMTGRTRASLMATLDALGAQAMLTRPDALPTLKSYEAQALLRHFARPLPVPVAPLDPPVIRAAH